MQKIVVGIVNSAIGTANMGCSALTYSLIYLLEALCQDHSLSAMYYLFDTGCSESDRDRMCTTMKIEKEKVKVFFMPHFDKRSIMGQIKRIKHIFDNHQIFDAMKSCTFLVDLTQGDSFTDLYGTGRFYRWTDIKKELEDRKLPLILGPQTYGPFSDPSIRDYAIQIIEGAKAVISRDQTSADYLRQYTDKEIVVGTDLAFELPYEKTPSESNGMLKVGINPSGLLGRTHFDMSVLTDSMRTDYEAYLAQIIDWIRKEHKYEIHMISHVGNEAINCFGGLSDVVYHPAFHSPVEAKNVIAGMDLFIGARMHATIAAFSCGIPVIPTAYSRKFSGLFSGIGYENVVDLFEMKTEQSVEKTIDYMKNVGKLKDDMVKSRALLDLKRKANYDFFEKMIMDIC